MMHETLKAFRKQKGYSQEEVAVQLNVVRQTISKWEKGLSVPDADMLIKLAELYGVHVSDLLHSPAVDMPQDAISDDFPHIADQLAQINEQLAIRNRRARRIWKCVLWTLISLTALIFLIVFLFTYRQPSSVDGRINAEVTIHSEQISDTLSNE